MNLGYGIKNCYTRLTNYVLRKETVIRREHSIKLPFGDYDVKIAHLGISKYTDGTPGDLTITFSIEDIPDELIKDMKFRYEIIDKLSFGE